MRGGNLKSAGNTEVLNREKPDTSQYAAKVGLLAAFAVAMAGAAIFLPPIAQDLAFHNFAEQRTFIGIPHFGDVVSNITFAIVALHGLALIASSRGRTLFRTRAEYRPWVVFFVGVGLISVGSAYYHANPNNETLVWDRLPMTIAFTAMFSAFVMDRVHVKVGTNIVLPLFVTLGVVSVVYWLQTETVGQGDLRFYYLVQLYAIVLIPLICIMFRGRITSGRSVFHILAIYALAIVCEQLDHEIYAMLGHTVSGHTVKHVLAAVAISMVTVMLSRKFSSNRYRDAYSS